MECLYCGGKTKVQKTQKINNRKYLRKRICKKCGERYTTLEVNEIDFFNLLDEILPEQLVDVFSHKFKNFFAEEKDTEF